MGGTKGRPEGASPQQQVNVEKPLCRQYLLRAVGMGTPQAEVVLQWVLGDTEDPVGLGFIRQNSAL